MKLPVQVQPVSRDLLGTTYLGFKAGIHPSQPTAECLACIAAARNSGNSVQQALNACRRLAAC